MLTLVHSLVAGGSHIDHADVLRSGGTSRVLPHRVMAPSTLGAGAWLGCAVLAHNLIRWTATLGRRGSIEELTVACTVRTRLIAIPGRIVNRAGTLTLRGPLDWPWAQWFTLRLDRLRALPNTG